VKLGVLFAVSSAAFLAGCGFVRDDTLVGPYRLVAVDVIEDTELCWSIGGGNVVCNLLPDGTVFAAGYNDKYITVAMHPDLRKRTQTQYFYLIRDPKTENDVHGDAHVARLGPFNEGVFAAEKKTHGLPEFSIVYEELK
jgi:hypothetical protein